MKKPAKLKKARVLSIDPTTRGFGFAVLEGPDRLVDWGVVHARREKNRHSLQRIDKLIQRYRPSMIVIEDVTRGSRRRPRIRELLLSIQKLAADRRIRLRSVTRQSVLRALSLTGKPTKHDIAVAVADTFPELKHRLPARRKPWQSEAEIMAVFDAVAFAILRKGVQ